MSISKLLSLYRELLELAEIQKKYLQEGMMNETLEFLCSRQKVIEEIQNIDRYMVNQLTIPSEIDSKDLEEESRQIYLTIENILSVDSDIQNIIRTNLNSLSDKLRSVSKMKAFINGINYNQTGTNLNLNI